MAYETKVLKVFPDGKKLTVAGIAYQAGHKDEIYWMNLGLVIVEHYPGCTQYRSKA